MSKYTLTFAFESLPEESVEEGSAVIAEGRRHVIVNAEPVRYVDFEPLAQVLVTPSIKDANIKDDASQVE